MRPVERSGFACNFKQTPHVLKNRQNLLTPLSRSCCSIFRTFGGLEHEPRIPNASLLTATEKPDDPGRLSKRNAQSLRDCGERTPTTMKSAVTTVVTVGARRFGVRSRGLFGAVAGGGHAFAPPSTVRPVPFTERASSLAMKA